jgi:hypothetical protein
MKGIREMGIKKALSDGRSCLPLLSQLVGDEDVDDAKVENFLANDLSRR